jgi:hypothetical protein
MNTAAIVVIRLAALILTASVAAAQTPAQRELPPPVRTINLTLEQRHTVKELVKDVNIEKAPADLQVDAGAEVPDKIALHDMPPLVGQKVPQVKAHKFFVVQDKIVLVDPKDRRISDVIE